MRWTLTLLLVGACSGPLSGVHLETLAESQRRALMTMTFPSVDRTDATVRVWDGGGGPEAAPLRHLLFAAYGVGAAAAGEVATDLPVGVGVARVDVPGPKGSVPTAVNALAFALRGTVSTNEWLESLGDIHDRSGPFVLVTQSERVAAPSRYGAPPNMAYAWRLTGTLFFHVDGNQLILSNTLRGLLVAGPAAMAARRGAAGDLEMNVHPQVWAGARLRELAKDLASFSEFLRQGRVPDMSPIAGMLAAANALYYLHPFAAASAVDFTLKVTAAGAELHARTAGPADTDPPLVPALDRTLVEERPAALGALDCRKRLGARQRLLNAAWQSAGNPGGRELEAMVDAEQATLAGSCSFAVHTTNEVWSEEASYPLRPEGNADALLAALTAAIRSGGLPNLQSATDDLRTDKLLFSTSDRGALSLDRVLGDLTSAQTRHAAALHGGPVLHDRFAVRDGRLVAVSGAHADERLEQLSAARAPRPLPAELDRALAAGRGKGGFLFLDLTALWKPYLKAAQVIQSPLADLVAHNPALLKERRPLVITLEPSPTLDATITMPPTTFDFLLTVAAILFGA